MVEYTDGSIEFKYSTQKLIVRMITGILLAVLGVLGAEAFMNLLTEVRTERILENIEQGLMTIPPDPMWAILVQFGTIILVVVGLFMLGISIIYIATRKRVFLRLTNEGVSYYRFKYHIIKMPYIKETYFDWEEIIGISNKKTPLLGDSIVLQKREVSSSDPKRTVELTISCSENNTEDIAMVMNRKRLGR